MATKKLFLSLLFICVGCAPTTAPTIPSPSVSPSASTTPSPSVLPSARPTNAPSPTAIPPSPIPSTSVVPPLPTALPTYRPPTPSPTPIPEPTPLSLPDYEGVCPPSESDIGIFNTSMTGKIINENNLPVEGMLLRVRTLNPCSYDFQTQVRTENDGTYKVTSVPFGEPIEIEVVQPGKPSGFYKTVLQSNKQQRSQVNYYPFVTISNPLVNCVAGSGPVHIMGNINLSSTSLSPETEGIVRARAISLCNTSGDAETLTKEKEYKLSIGVNMTAPGVKSQLTLSMKGRPTSVKYVSLPIIPPSEETYDFILPTEAPEFLELPSEWDTNTIYQLPEQIPEN